MFQVFPAMPEPLAFLETLSRNLWWCWHLDAIELFRRIDQGLWGKSNRNPIAFFPLISQARWNELAEDDAFMAHMDRVKDQFNKEVDSILLNHREPYHKGETIAYLSMEFGIHESLPLFAGGLGVLAGDHLKAASDLKVPLIGVGLLYQEGYFRQFLDQGGWQQEEYPAIEISHLPIERVRGKDGGEIRISVVGADRKIYAAVWQIQIGRIPLILLDTDVPENSPEIRKTTARLYSSHSNIRLAQEVLLGFGGLRALEAMGIIPTVVHMNEGHAAFAGIEHLRQIMTQHGVDLATAMEIGARTAVFTTHTPVAAGHDEFPIEEVKPYMIPMEESLGVKAEQIVSWGQSEPSGKFSMFVLGLRMSMYKNGVSELHGRTARRMWSHVWPGWIVDEVPITHITNGVHIPSWISIENAMLFDRYLGPEWYLKTWNSDRYHRIDGIYDDELWRSRELSRSRLIRFCRNRVIQQHMRRNAPRSVMEQAESVLDADILTIAFARRFTAYKRATLLLKDPDRLEKILNNDRHPVQLIFSGKAHPKDDEGKNFIKELFQFAQRPSVRNRFVFLEDYDIYISRHLIQGADVWLNNPRRPLEASGTSGMKAAANGVLNVSILDGWWNEGYRPERGWIIGHGEEYTDLTYQDSVESRALYNLLEYEVIPCFYERKNGEAPKRWIGMMKESMKMAVSDFCTHRMVNKYESQFYLPAMDSSRSLTVDGSERARQKVKQRNRLQALWGQVQIKPPVRKSGTPLRVGEKLQVVCEVNLGELTPEEVVVELYYGNLKSTDQVVGGMGEPMQVVEKRDNGVYYYQCTVECKETGRFGFTARAFPKGDNLEKFMTGLIRWA